MHPKWIRKEHIISATIRTSERRFFFKPSPQIADIIGACAARAQQRFPVKLYWLECNINHIHYGLAPTDNSAEAAENFVRFRQLFHRLLAENINRHLQREGALFAARASDVPCIDDESVHDRFYYAVTNPVKDGLCHSVKSWKGFSSYPFVALGKAARFQYLDRTAWHRAGAVNTRAARQACMRTAELQFTPLPGTERWTAAKRRTQIEAQVAEREAALRQERKQQGLTTMTAAQLSRLSHFDRPRNPKPNTPRPLCHGASELTRAQFRVAHRAFLTAYREASRRYLQGHWLVAFPAGSLRPPVLRPVADIAA
jgi:REP element-mobilizing transposase RayT